MRRALKTRSERASGIATRTQKKKRTLYAPRIQTHARWAGHAINAGSTYATDALRARGNTATP
eukprot:11200916-Lingulodinium_polyedra.AAC.1